MNPTTLAKLYQRHFNILLALTLLGLALLAWSERFIQDDAFISFRYAYNLANGRGLVWNEAEWVEGYTNFLWTVLYALPIYLNIDPVRFTFVLGPVLFVISLFFTYKLGQRLLSSRDRALVATIFLGSNHTFLIYATGGLETQLQTALLTTSIYVSTRLMQSETFRLRELYGLSLLLALAVLTRLDSLLLAAILIVVLLHVIFASKLHAKGKLLGALGLLLPLGVLVGCWLLWKARYYGQLLPNTYYVKLATQTSYKQGLLFLFHFFDSYWLALFPILLLLSVKRLLDRSQRGLLLLLVIIFFWSLYILRAGGDFMEFRFLVPVLPCVFVVITWLIFSCARSSVVRSALIVLVISGSFHHAKTFRDLKEGTVWSVESLSSQIRPNGRNWEGIGRSLGEIFDHDQTITIATTAGGAIPYYSRLKTIDMHGLTDKWVARHGRILGSIPGHQRVATLSYLVERGSNLVIGMPVFVSDQYTIRGLKIMGLEDRSSLVDYLRDTGQIFNYFFIPPAPGDVIPADAKLLEIPIAGDRAHRKLLVIYLLKHSRIDELIKERGWQTHPLSGLAAPRR